MIFWVTKVVLCLDQSDLNSWIFRIIKVPKNCNLFQLRWLNQESDQLHIITDGAMNERPSPIHSVYYSTLTAGFTNFYINIWLSTTSQLTSGKSHHFHTLRRHQRQSPVADDNTTTTPPLGLQPPVKRQNWNLLSQFACPICNPFWTEIELFVPTPLPPSLSSCQNKWQSSQC